MKVHAKVTGMDVNATLANIRIAKIVAKSFVQLTIDEPEGNDPKDLLMGAISNGVRILQKQDPRNVSLLCSMCITATPTDDPFEALKASCAIVIILLVMELDKMEPDTPFIKLLKELYDKATNLVSTATTSETI